MLASAYVTGDFYSINAQLAKQAMLAEVPSFSASLADNRNTCIRVHCRSLLALDD